MDNWHGHRSLFYVSYGPACMDYFTLLIQERNYKFITGGTVLGDAQFFNLLYAVFQLAQKVKIFTNVSKNSWKIFKIFKKFENFSLFFDYFL